MSLYAVVFKKQLINEIRKSPAPVRDAIGKAIRLLQEDPRRPGVKKLTGTPKSEAPIYRYRPAQLGHMRILYNILDGQLIIHVIEISDRRDVYR